MEGEKNKQSLFVAFWTGRALPLVGLAPLNVLGGGMHRHKSGGV